MVLYNIEMSNLDEPFLHSYLHDFEDNVEDDGGGGGLGGGGGFNFNLADMANVASAREEALHHPDSDEDTEEASETDTGGRSQDEPIEIKEQMYQDKLGSLKKRLQQLKDGTHADYNRRVKRLEFQFRERLRLNGIHRDYRLDYVERDYMQEKRTLAKELEDKKIDLRENLIADLEDKKRLIEAERFAMELTNDTAEVKHAMTRKLRRRPNEPAPVPEKRRKTPSAQITYLLDEKDVEFDLKMIQKGKILAAASAAQAATTAAAAATAANATATNVAVVRKSSESLPLSPHHLHSPIQIQQMSPSEVPLLDTHIEDGKLLYEKRWFHRGQPVYVEGQDVTKFAGNISAIGNDVVWVKKLDGCKVRIFLVNLARGKISIKRRAS